MINEEALAKLSPGKQAIVWIGQSMDHCFPGQYAWGGYAAFYLALAKQHPELAEYLLKEATDTGTLPPSIQRAIDTIVEDSKDWFK